jgi:hypothetical protein
MVRKLLFTFVLLGAFLALAAPALGEGYVYQNRFGDVAHFPNAPYFVCTDPAGNVYVTGGDASIVVKFTKDGAPATSWGSAGTGNGQFQSTTGICYDSADGLICVSDWGNHRIQEFTRSGDFVREIGDAYLNQPQGICYDAALGELIVANYGAGNLVALSPDGSTGGVLSTPGVTISTPGCVAYDAARAALYVSDIGNSVVALDASGTYTGTVASGFFQIGVAVDARHNVVIDDNGNNRVQVYSPDGTYLRDVSADAGGPAPGFSSPYGVGTAPDGSVYVLNVGNSRIDKYVYDNTGPVLTHDYDGEWYSQPFSIYFSATDDFTAVPALDWSTDGGSVWTPSDHFDVPVAFDHSYDGVHPLKLRASDSVGNTTVKNLRVKIDTKAPVTQIIGDTPYWVNGDVPLRFVATDVGSGVGGTEYSTDYGLTWLPVPGDGTVTFSSETPVEGTPVWYRSYDNCADSPNVEDGGQTSVFIDKTNPVVAALANVTVVKGKTASFKYTVTDNLSDHCWMSLVIKKGTKIVKSVDLGGKASPNTPTPTTLIKKYKVTLSPGKYTWHITGYDYAGNSGQSPAKKLTVKKP